MGKFQISIIAAVFAQFAVQPEARAAACFADPEALFRASPALSTVYSCERDQDLELCQAPVHKGCRRINISGTLDRLNSTDPILGNKSAAAAVAFAKENSPRKKVLATYLAAMNYREGIIIDRHFSVQTGQYPQVTISPQALNSKCMATIVQTAYRLHSQFPDYNFIIDSHIQNCQNLRDGVKVLLAESDRVKRNLDRFHSPLHSVYLTNRTRFVHRTLGQMGLHVNVNRPGEVRLRLVDFAIRSIPTDSPGTRLSGLAN